MYNPNSLPTAALEFYLPNCVGFFVAWRTQLSKTVKETKDPSTPKHIRDCFFLCFMCVCLRTCICLWLQFFPFFRQMYLCRRELLCWKFSCQGTSFTKCRSSSMIHCSWGPKLHLRICKSWVISLGYCYLDSFRQIIKE